MQPHLIGRTIRILQLDDCAADAELIKGELERAELAVIVRCVDSPEAFSRALVEFVPDVILSDHSFAEFDAHAALKVAVVRRPTAPFIVVAEAVDTQTAVDIMRAGAEDIVLKENLGRLVPAIDAALSVRRQLLALSPRQLEVLQLVAEGRTTPEIALQLNISVKTVEAHRGEVTKRLGIHDVASLARYAARVGLVRN